MLIVILLIGFLIATYAGMIIGIREKSDDYKINLSIGFAMFLPLFIFVSYFGIFFRNFASAKWKSIKSLAISPINYPKAVTIIIVMLIEHANEAKYFGTSPLVEKTRVEDKKKIDIKDDIRGFWNRYKGDSKLYNLLEV